MTKFKLQKTEKGDWVVEKTADDNTVSYVYVGTGSLSVNLASQRACYLTKQPHMTLCMNMTAGGYQPSK